jgi:site-specific recombinase XerC
MWEGPHFLSWYTSRGLADDLTGLNIRDIDIYFEMRAAGLRRRSLKDVAERLRSLMRFLHGAGRIGVDLAPRIIGPMLYAYESIPSALSAEQISGVLKSTRKDLSPMGSRDYAILLFYRPTDCVTEKSRGCGSRTSIGEPKRYTSAIPRPGPTRSCH